VLAVIAALLTVGAIYVPAPGPLGEPPLRSRLFGEAPMMVLSGGAETLLPFAKADRSSPTYAFSCMIAARTSTHRGITYGAAQSPDSTFGFFRREGAWTYQLVANRLDRLPESTEAPRFATKDMCARWRPLLVAYLNANSTGHDGDALEQMLNQPSKSASRVCWQNAIVLGAWIAAPTALVMLLAAGISMLRGPRALPTTSTSSTL
jgi:hypothetical protein